MANLRVGASTDTGQLRPANEDSLLVTPSVFVVADGMGGHEAGEVASQTRRRPDRASCSTATASRRPDDRRGRHPDRQR